MSIWKDLLEWLKGYSGAVNLGGESAPIIKTGNYTAADAYSRLQAESQTPENIAAAQKQKEKEAEAAKLSSPQNALSEMQKTKVKGTDIVPDHVGIDALLAEAQNIKNKYASEIQQAQYGISKPESVIIKNSYKKDLEKLLDSPNLTKEEKKLVSQIVREHINLKPDLPETWLKDPATKDPIAAAGAGLVDLGTGLVEGIYGTFEGLSDFILHGAGYGADLFGAEGAADYLHGEANYDSAGNLFAPLEDAVKPYSPFGSKTEQGERVVGNFVGQMILSGATAGAGSAVPVIAQGASAAGSGISEAYNAGATDEEALAYGLTSGAWSAITESVFGGLGKGITALGISKGIGGLDDIFANKVTNKIKNIILRNAVQLGIKASGEGLEEVLDGLGSAVLKKMTYMSDKDLGDLIANENLLDSFLTGVVLSAGAQTGGYVKSVKNKTDLITERTDIEESVVKKEAENRIKEQETKLKKELGIKEKNDIYDRVVKDLEKGYISTDVIEEVLGGDIKKAYDGLTEEAKEYETLYNTKASEMSKAQQDRLAELEARVKERSYRDRQSDTKNALRENAIKVIKGERGGKGSLLAESYNEGVRRGQKFTADLSAYDEKQRATVQRAIDSGVLNNTNRSHDFVDMVAKLEAEKGVKFDFANNAKLKESGFALDGKVINGVITDDGITINIDSPKALGTVVGHEIAHVLEGTELYGELQSALFKYAKSKGEYQQRLDSITSLYKGVKADIKAELTADLIGDYIFSDADFVRKLSAEHRNIFEKIYDEIKYLLKIATAGSKEARELERVKRAFEEAYRESGAATSDTKYSLNIKYTDGSVEVLADARGLTNEQAVKYLEQAKSGKLKGQTYIPVRKDTPQVIIDTLKQVNEDISDRSLVMQVRKVQQSMSDAKNSKRDEKYGNNVRKHGLSAEEIVEIVNKLDNPSVMVYQTNRQDQYGNPLPNNVAVLVEHSFDGNEGVAVIEFDSVIDSEFIGTEFGDIDYHTIVTIFEPDTERNGIPFDYAEELLSNPDNIELEIERRQSTGSATRENHPNTSSELPSYDGIIPQNETNVKREFSISSDSDTSRQRGGVYGEDVRFEAPVAEDLTGATETAEMTENTAPIQNVTEPKMKRADSKKTAPDGMEERAWYETSTGSKAVDNMITPDDISDEVRYYQVKSNEKTLATANARLARDGYAKSREYFEGRMSERKLTVEDIALGERLIQEAAKAGDSKAVRDLIIDVSIIGTELGQRVQALSMIRRLTPEGQLKALTRTVERGKAKGDKAFEGVEITQEMIDYILKTYGKDGTYDQTELNKAVEDVKQQIADQMHVSVADYINAWRYLSMLGNPKTHIRNVVSNVAMFGTRTVKNAIARTAEDIFLRNQKPTLNTEKAEKPIAPMRDVMPAGTRVKAADRDNIGIVRSFNPQTGKYTVYFENKSGHNATVQLDANILKPLNPPKRKSSDKANGSDDVAPVNYRTKTWRRSSDAVKSFAEQTTKEMESAIKGENKYSDEGGIKEKRNIFKTKAGNWMANANNNAMEFEDAIFSKSAFRSTLSEYLTANGIKTEADIKNNPALVEKAKDYALEEAHRATFRQDSWVANKISEIERKNLLTSVAVGSIMPFKKTPINIAKTGLAYSPLGLARSFYDAVQVGKGKMDASEAIDHLAQGMTGTALALIGFALAEAGILNGAGDDDKEGEYDYQLGEQSYSFNFGGDSYSLSWLSPVSMPLFIGANAYEQLVENKEWDADVVMETLAQTLDPMSEMSFLSSLDDVLSSYDSGVEKFAGIAESMGQSYVSQFIPTLSSQIAQTFDDTKRSTKVSADSGYKFGEETLNKIKYKIPGLRNTLEPATDIWGNEIKQSDNVLERGFEAFLSPASRKEYITTAVDEELKALYGQVGESELLPAIPDNYINYEGDKYEMSARDYTEYKEAYGQTAFELMEKLFDTETYKNADSKTRADMVKRVYDYARDNAKLGYFTKFGVDYTNAQEEGEEVYKENPIKGAIEADLPIDEYVFSRDYPKKYEILKENNVKYKHYINGSDAFKEAYTWASNNPEKYKVSKVITDDVVEYRKHARYIANLPADKDKNGNTISGSKKKKVVAYINGLDLDAGAKYILYKMTYPSSDDYNAQIVKYLDGRDDISYDEMVEILTALGMKVNNGRVTW